MVGGLIRFWLPTGLSPGLPAEVLYAGPVPLEVEGLSQVNVLVPGVLGRLFFQSTARALSSGRSDLTTSAAWWTVEVIQY
jgi:hypothetical protein